MRSIFAMCSFIVLLALSTAVRAERGLNVAVIAESVSTRIEARNVMRRQGWTEETDFRRADAILVVCRSGLMLPLNDTYRSISDLHHDVEGLLNITGDNYHVYIFRINSNLGVEQSGHINYPAE